MSTTPPPSRDRKIAPVYVIWNGELMLDAPCEQAWPHVIDYPRWQNFTLNEHVSGKPGEEGEVVLLKKEEGYEFPPYFARTIKLEPGRRIIWKTYSHDPRSDGDFFGIVEFRLDGEGAKTRFSSSMIYEFLVPYEDESELVAFRDAQYKNVATMTASVFPKLIDLIKLS